MWTPGRTECSSVRRVSTTESSEYLWTLNHRNTWYFTQDTQNMLSIGGTWGTLDRKRCIFEGMQSSDCRKHSVFQGTRGIDSQNYREFWGPEGTQCGKYRVILGQLWYALPENLDLIPFALQWVPVRSTLGIQGYELPEIFSILGYPRFRQAKITDLVPYLTLTTLVVFARFMEISIVSLCAAIGRIESSWRRYPWT